MSRVTYVRESDTDPLFLTVSARGLSNLNALSSAVIYLREEGESVNHVDGVALVVESSSERLLSFDPVGAKSGGGNAFDAPGKYLGYVLCTFLDGDTSRHPAQYDLVVVVRPNFE